MNARRIHNLMRCHFPHYDAAQKEWINMADRQGLNCECFARLLSAFFCTGELMVEVHRKQSALLPLEQVPAYVAAHMGEGSIHIADRDFTAFVVLAANGVVTAWRRDAAAAEPLTA